MTPTPNPTAEQIVAEAMVNAGAPLMHSRVEEAVVAALRAHGLLAEGAPSEKQIKRAAKAYLNGGIYTLESDGEHHARMRAALTAAGVDPQEPLQRPGEYDDDFIDRGARALHETQNPWVVAHGSWAAAGHEIQQAFRESARVVLAAAGVAPQEPSTAAHSTAAASALCDEVIADLGDNVQTHGPDCYRWHAGCLALRVRQALAPQEPNVLAGRCRTCGGEVLEGTAEDVIDYLDAPPPDREKLIAEAEAHWVELNGLNSRAAEVMMELAALAAQPVLDLNAERADAWEEGVATALNHAKRGSGRGVGVVSDYTPTLGEAEGRYSAGRLLLDGERDAGTATERYDEFYRMIAAIEREAAARALEEAASADEVFAEYADGESYDFNRGISHGADVIFEKLRARAVEIREGKSNG